MDEVRELCRRVLGPGPSADEAYREALLARGVTRLDRLAAAVRACRARDRDEPPEPATANGTLASAVANELAAASARLPSRQREVLVLRELLRLSHDQITTVIGIDAPAVPPLLARARLRLRAELRGAAGEEEEGCAQQDRSLRALVRRQDSEPLSEADDRWILAHLRECPACTRAHAAMLEASVCYRPWRMSRRRLRPPSSEHPVGAAER